MIHINQVFYLLCINTFMQTFQLPSLKMFNSLAEPNKTKSYKLERGLFKTLECFPSALFPKIWNSIELPSVPTLTLSILPFPYTPSPPPYLFHDLSSFLCLKCTMYIVFIWNSHSFILGQTIKTTYSGQAGPNFIVNCDFLFVLFRALQLNKNITIKYCTVLY